MKKLYYGDNLVILREKIPENSVDLCYIDPPFNSKRSYFQIYNNIGGEQDTAQMQAFVDTWTWDRAAENGFAQITSNYEGRFTRQVIELIRGLEIILGKGDLLAYLVSMTLRITEIYRVLKPTGSFYLHCDPTASHYLKLVLDAVFCGQNGEYQNEIIWKRTGSHGGANKWGPIHDTILFYSKSDNYTWNRVYQDYDDSYIKKYYRFTDERGKYRLVTLTGAGITQTGDSGKPWRGVDPTKSGRHWAVPTSALQQIITNDEIKNLTTQEKLDILDEAGIIYWPKRGSVPQQKRYLDEADGVVIQDIITDIRPISSHAAERMGYPTQKPEELLERIIEASSNEGDVVLDAYCGCGTTIAVAERLNRNWIGIDITYHSIGLMLKRLADSFGDSILDHVSVDGIPRDVEAARALATREDDKVRKEFEKWAALTYTNNRAVINEKKGADKGIDAIVYFAVAPSKTERMVIQVKSGHVNRGTIAKLRGDMDREKAKMAVLITLDEPSKPMVEEAVASGVYHHTLMGRDYPRVKIVTVREIIEERERLNLPLSYDSVKPGKKTSGENNQLQIDF